MTNDRQDPAVRRGALTLSYLALTPDSALETFAKQHVVCEGIGAERVATLRNVLDALGNVVASDSRDDWRKIEQAWEALRHIKRPKAQQPAHQMQPNPVNNAVAPRPAARPPSAPSQPRQRPAHAVAPPTPTRAATTAPAPKPAHEVSETSFLEVSEIMGTPMPFLPDAPSAPVPSGHFVAHGSGGATTAVSSAEIEAAIGRLPTPSDDKLPMELNDYASLVAHTEMGGPAASIEARHERHTQRGIDGEAQRTAIDVTFSDYFRKRPAAFQQYLGALEKWRAWLKTQR